MQNPTLLEVGTIAFSANGKKDVTLAQMDSGLEVYGFRLQFEATWKGAAGAFALAAADFKTILELFASNLYGTWDGDNEALKMQLAQMRAILTDFDGGDPYQLSPAVRTGLNVPANGAPAAVKFPVDVLFGHRGADTPNGYTKSSDQLNLNPLRFAVDWVDPTAGGGNAITNGTVIFTSVSLRIYAMVEEAYGIFCGPHWTYEQKGATAQTDEEKSPAIEWGLFMQGDPATIEATFANLTINVDGKLKPLSIAPTALAMQYVATRFPLDPQRAYELCQNTLTGTPSSQWLPLRWVAASRKPAEYELPYFTKVRQVKFNKSGAYNFIRVKSDAIRRQANIIRALLKQASDGRANETDDDRLLASLVPRGFGGGDNSTLADFKGVWIKKIG